ncbi:MAG: hypothetical protein AAB926_00200 [Patescibacteria group bacterium]
MKPSLLPKTSLASKSIYRPRKTSFLAVFSVGAFFISAGILAGGYFYKSFLETRIKELNDTLKRTESEFEPASIKELARTSDLIKNSKIVLTNHKTPSKIFLLLENLTSPSVRFSSFSFGEKDGEYSAVMNGEAKSYTAIAEQAAVFSQSDLVKKASFSNFSLKNEGNVSFNVSLIINPDLLKF